MYGQIYTPLEESVFEFLNEDSLRSNLAKARLLEFVAGSFHDHKF